MSDGAPCTCGQRAVSMRLIVAELADAAGLSVRHGQIAMSCVNCGRSVYVQFEVTRERALPPFVGLERGT